MKSLIDGEEKKRMCVYLWKTARARWVSHERPSSFQSLSFVWLFVTPWTAALQASLSITSSRSLLKLKSIKSVVPSNCLILCHPLLLLPWIFPRISNLSQSFPMNHLFASGGQSIGVSASTSVLPMNIQGWFPLGLTGGSPCSPRDSWESSPTPQFKCNSSVLSILAWRSPWTVEPIGSQRIRHEWVTFTHTLTLFSVLYGPILTSTQDYWT